MWNPHPHTTYDITQLPSNQENQLADAPIPNNRTEEGLGDVSKKQLMGGLEL